MLEFCLILVSLLAGGLIAVLFLRRKASAAPLQVIRTQTVAERVRAVGKLVGLEVHAKEIATSTKGWSWLPPIILSQAKIAMIFHFEKQYYVDLSRLSETDVTEQPASAGARAHYRAHLPSVEGTLRLTDVTPYDIQAGRVLGLIDVIQMNAETQRQLMQAAQEQAAALYTQAEPRYVAEAQRSIERQLQSLLALFEARVDVAWDQPHDGRPRMTVESGLEQRLSAMAARR